MSSVIPEQLPGTVASFPRAVNPQSGDLLSGMQINGPNKQYETVAFTVGQLQELSGFSSPPPIGNVIPNSGAFTLVTAGNLPINVKSYGAKGDGSTDDTAAIRAAMAAGAGHTVYFPAGTYQVSGYPIVIASNTHVVGDGREVSIIRPNGLTSWIVAGVTAGPTVFVGYLYSQLGAFVSSPTPPGGVYDVNIAIEDLCIDFTQQSAAVGSFIFTQQLSFNNLRFIGTSANGLDGPSCLACDRVTMRNCVGDNVEQMLDCWMATTRVKLNDLDVVVKPGGGNGGAFNFQGVGTVNNGGHSWQYEASNINVQLAGGVVFFLDSQGDGSIVSDVLLENVTVIATGAINNQVAVGRGRGGRVKISNFNCVALDGATWNTPILIGGFATYLPAEIGTNKIATVSGSNIITVTFTGGTDAGIGNYVDISNGAGGAVIGNGLSLIGSYKIISVSNRNANYNWQTVTCDARADATATGPVSATTQIYGSQGAFQDCELNGITFDGAQTNGVPIISLGGYGHLISNVGVTTNYGPGISTPQYNVVIQSAPSGEPDITQRPNNFGNIIAVAGTGVPGGYAGNAIVCWLSSGPAPRAQQPTTLTSLEVSDSVNISDGPLYYGGNANAAIPAAFNYGCLTWNYIAGQQEIDYWNLGDGLISHTFWQAPGGSNAVRLMDIGPTGDVKVYGSFSLNGLNATSASDVSRGITFDGTVGVAIYNGNLNLVAGAPYAILFGNFPGYINATGYNGAIGAQSPATGVFTSISIISLTNAVDDAAAAAAGVPIEGVYRNGSQLMVRVS